MAAGMAQLSARMRRGDPISSRETIRMVAALSLPSILEQAVTTAMQYIDAAMVGHLGAAATASIGVVSSTTWLFGGLMGGLSTGFAVQIAQYLGAKREQDARNVLRQAMMMNLLAGLLLGGIAFALSFPLPGWLGAEPAIRADSSGYFGIYALTLPATMGLMQYSAILRCTGDARTPGLLNALTCPLDVLFNFLLIYPTRTVRLGGGSATLWGAGLGVRGAALGTSLATVLVALAMLGCLLLREGPLCIRRPGVWRFTRTCMLNLRRIGLPVAAERSALCTAQIALVRIVAGLGTVSVAANSLAVNAEGLCYMPGYGIQAAAITLTGQAVGAGRRDMAARFARVSTLAGTLLMSCGGILLFLFAPQLMSIFTQDAEVIALGAGVLRIEAFAEPLFGASIVASGAMQGAGDAKAPFLIDLFSMWGVRITLATMLVGSLGLRGVWLAMCCELCLRGVLFLVRLLRGRWLSAAALH